MKISWENSQIKSEKTQFHDFTDSIENDEFPLAVGHGMCLFCRLKVVVRVIRRKLCLCGCVECVVFCLGVCDVVKPPEVWWQTDSASAFIENIFCPRNYDDSSGAHNWLRPNEITDYFEHRSVKRLTRQRQCFRALDTKPIDRWKLVLVDAIHFLIDARLIISVHIRLWTKSV